MMMCSITTKKYGVPSLYVSPAEKMKNIFSAYDSLETHKCIALHTQKPDVQKKRLFK